MKKRRIFKNQLIKSLKKHKKGKLTCKDLNISYDLMLELCKKYKINHRQYIFRDYEQYLDKRFGELIVNGYDSKYFICTCLLCNKDNVKIFKHYLLRKHGSISCQECNLIQTRENNPYWNGYKLLSGHQFSRYRSGAKKRNIKFDITIQNVWELYEKLDGACPILEEKFVFESLNPKTIQTTNMSIDRIDNKIGYDLNNIFLVHKDFNKFHHIYNLEHILHLSKLIISPNQCNETNFNIITEIPQWYLTQIKGNLKLRPHLEYKVSTQDLLNQFNKQRGLCYYTGLSIQFGRRQLDRVLQTASLDRIDNNKGYLVDNIVWCHKDVNFIKKDFTLERFYHIARMTVKNLPNLLNSLSV